MNNNTTVVYRFSRMEEQEARQIADWKYEPPYSMYNSNDPEDIGELMDGSYYAVHTYDHELIGFFCFGQNARVPGGTEQGLYTGDHVLDIGLGLKPEYTGMGRGLGFLRAGLDFAAAEFKPDKYRLTVAAFNKRAISLYHTAGFNVIGAFIKQNPGNSMEFAVMELG
ncbi:GNAT family N-acetyltransferase [Paenibacillus sp. PK3_47]|uniref:GNAT family N-acetyltransferase n=1 Tax=Paenibacillus sp. PK3_47 TaxID=2072642 RepID=UPI00201DC522|nr:GNAT family N-acetyltransferase [Paenibacillus sp. PK3_47]